ncbi:MAG: hypothetical protein QOI74_2324, partial [Micromonosporaceae bacterium]|nr:hypothetical protein [Micromonosporaceae bacterium]
MTRDPHPPKWRAVGGALAALAAAGALLALPGHRSVGVVATADTGPRTLADRWPRARPVSLSAVLPDGDSYAPMLVLDRDSSIGTATSPDAISTSLVALTGSRPPRVLQTITPGSGDIVDAVVATPARLYWIRSVTDERGIAHAAVWTADRSGGPARELVADAGAAVVNNSRYDLLIAGGRLRWVTTAATTPPATQLRSVSLDGGPVEVRTIPGVYAQTAWPWLTSAAGGVNGPADLYNPLTGKHIPIAVRADQQATCTPTRCRVVTADGAGSRIEVQRPDGRDRRRITDAGQAAALTDAAVLDRFEFLITIAPAGVASSVQQGSMYDLTDHRTIALGSGVTMIVARGDWLWWSTGDNE